MSKIKTLLGVVPTIISLISAMPAAAATYKAWTPKLTNVIAKTLYAEARSEGAEGVKMVAAVIFNRGKGRYESCITECLRKSQFSCWNGRKDIVVDVKTETYDPGARWTDAQAWAYCKQLEYKIMAKTFIPAGVWTHYATADCRASRLKTMTHIKRYKNHVFGCA